MIFKKFKFENLSGFSLIEAILSLAVFMVLATGLVGALTYGMQSPQMAGANSRAIMLAEEGLEVARNIRDSSYSSLTAGTYGLAASGVWALAGSSDNSGIFNRQLIIADLDSNRKMVTSTVSYNTGQGTTTVSLATWLTNWRRTMATLGGLLVYGDTTTSTKLRTYDASLDAFSAESAIALNASGQTFIVRASPTSNEAIAGFVTSAGVLYVMCYDGSVWSQEWTDTVGGTGTTRRFDIAYSTASGTAMVLYSTNVGTTNELAYRTKLGNASCGSGNWAGAVNLNPIRTSGVVQWVKMAWDRRAGQNLIAAQWADANSDLSAMIWSGTTWGNEPSSASATALDVVATAQDIESFDLEYESLSGDLMMIWGIAVGNNTNGVRYRVCPGGTATCTWGAITTPPTFTDDAVSLDLSANPNTDQLVFASIGTNQSDLQLGYWGSSTWTNTLNADTSCNPPTAGSKLVATGWLISGITTRSIVRYADQGSSAIDWYTGNGGIFNKENDVTVSPAANGPIYYDIQMNPLDKSQLMLLTSDSANDLFAKRLVMSSTPGFAWTNSDGAALELTLPQSINSPYAFTFWRN